MLLQKKQMWTQLLNDRIMLNGDFNAKVGKKAASDQ